MSKVVHTIFLISSNVLIIVISTATGQLSGVFMAMTFTPVLVGVDPSFIWRGVSFVQLGGLFGIIGGVAAGVYFVLPILRRKPQMLKGDRNGFFRTVGKNIFRGSLSAVICSSVISVGLRILSDNLSLLSLLLLSTLYVLSVWIPLGFVVGLIQYVVRSRKRI